MSLPINYPTDYPQQMHLITASFSKMKSYRLMAECRLGSPYRTSSNRTEPYRAFSSRIATPLGIFEREPNRIEVPMLALDNVRFE